MCKRRWIPPYVLLLSRTPEECLIEMARAFHLSVHEPLFYVRCTVCNGVFSAVPASHLLPLFSWIPARYREGVDDDGAPIRLQRCTGVCGRVRWWQSAAQRTERLRSLESKLKDTKSIESVHDSDSTNNNDDSNNNTKMPPPQQRRKQRQSNTTTYLQLLHHNQTPPPTSTTTTTTPTPPQTTTTITMETPTWAAYAAAWLATAAILLLSTHLRRRRTPKLNLPPGPKPWPIIGNLNLIGSLPHRSIHDLSQKYGPIMHLRFGSFPVVVGSSVDMAKIFLKTMDVTFVGRPKTAAGKYTTYNYSDITWSPYGPYWRQARKMCLMELFSAKRLESFEYIRNEEMKSLLTQLFKLSGDSILLKHHLSTVSLNVISRMVLGKRYLDEDEEDSIVSPDEFKKMLDELFLLNGVFNIGDSIPWIDFLDLQGYVKRMKVLAKKFDRFLEHVLDEHNERRKVEGDEFVAKDMVDVLLELADDPTLEIKLQRHGVKAFTQDLLAGGTESSAVTVEWAISELLKKPEIFKKATAELDRVIGRDRWVEEKDIANLPYIEAIVKETMRMHPVAPMLVPRQCREDCKVAGYDIAEGTRILVSVWTIGRDPELWDAPNEFCPDRFIGKAIDVKGHDFELLPFGAGRRMCPGYSLGLKVIQASLANLLHGFTWDLPRNVNREDLNMEEIFGLSTPKKFPLIAVVQPRLPLHLYAM